MSRFLYALRDVVWSAVLAVVFTGLSILLAVIDSSAPALPIAFGAAAITSALLAQRA